MAGSYDMCVDYDVLCDIEDKLQKIEYNLNKCADQMAKAIQESQGFLAGNQFEKAQRTTASCVEITRRTGNNIRYAVEYIVKLRTAMDEYGKCGYNGEVYNENNQFSSVKKQ